MTTEPVEQEYGLDGVDRTGTRGDLILTLLVLSDRAYQDWVWVTGRMQYTEQKGMNHFGMQISFAWEFLLDDIFVLDKGVQGTDYWIGTIYKSEIERDAVEEVAHCVRKYARAIDARMNELVGSLTNAPPEVCMSTPGRDELIAASKKAFDIFMETEKDNAQFVTFIEETKERMKKGDLI